MIHIFSISILYKYLYWTTRITRQVFCSVREPRHRRAWARTNLTQLAPSSIWVNPWTLAGNLLRHCSSSATWASVALVELYRTESTTPAFAVVGFTWPTRRRLGTCEQVDVMCLAVATDVFGANVTSIHCWPSCLSNCAQPPAIPARVIAAAAMAADLRWTARLRTHIA